MEAKINIGNDFANYKKKFYDFLQDQVFGSILLNIFLLLHFALFAWYS